MHARRLKTWLLALGLLGVGTAALAGLAAYVNGADSDFRWSKGNESTAGSVKILDLQVRSQVWRGIPWDHQVRVFLPPDMKQPRTALLFITGGNPGATDTLMFAALAPRISAPLVVLYNIPNQPLFEGKSEDDLIAHTFQEYLKSGDETWPLLLPMAKSAVRTMDAVQQLSRREWPAPVEGFVLTGASKRGWTTYLTGAMDDRVRGIAPMVFDNLKFHAQMPRQLELWGRYSEQIEDYTRRGLQEKMETPQGKKLVSMVDPWYYRDRLTMPKLLIHGSNDRYWATDAVSAYWDDLKGEKHLLVVPNAGHGLEDRARVVNSMTAFFHSVAAGTPFPRLTAEQRSRNGKVSVRVRSTKKPERVRLWTVRAGDLDFRPAKWESAPMEAKGDRFTAEAPVPDAGGLAVFAEAEYAGDGQSYTLSTPVQVYGTRGASAQVK